MKRIKTNESTSSKGPRRNQTIKRQSGVKAMACILFLEDGSAIWFFRNSATGPEGWYPPKRFLVDQEKFREAIERTLGPPANSESGQAARMNIRCKSRDDKQLSKQKE